MNSILAAPSQVKAQASPEFILITSSQGKFFSNGLDLPWTLAAASSSVSAARSRLNYMLRIFKTLVAQLLSFPMPPVATVVAAAAGLVLALSHDYLIMRSDRGVLYMRELDLGAILPDFFVALARSKIGSSWARPDVFLRGMKVRGEAAVRMGVVESAHRGQDGVMEAAVRLAEELAARNWDGEPYAEIRKSLYPEISGLLGLTRRRLAISKL